MGVTTPDIWGGNRTPEQERYASSILALNATTGKNWREATRPFTTTPDMDLLAQLTLADEAAHENVGNDRTRSRYIYPINN